jgi:hypothetical protein
MKSKLLTIALVAVIGFSTAACGGDDGDGGGGDGGNWLWVNTKQYKVTNGAAGDIDYEYDVTWKSYTDDKHWSNSYSYTQQINTTSANYSAVGTNQITVDNSRDGNTLQYTSSYRQDLTINNNGTPQSSTSDTTTTGTTVYDEESGLTLSSTYQQTGTQNGTSYSYNQESRYTIELLSTEDSVKTYKSTLTEMTFNGETLTESIGSYTVYKMQNGIQIEGRSYKADGTLEQTYVYTFPDDPAIIKKTHGYYIGSTNSDSSYKFEVVSDSDTELRFLVKHYSNGVLTGQSEETYRPR